MKKVFFILTLFITSISFAQLENNHWCFGYRAGADFSSGTAIGSTSSINNNVSGYGVGAASVSDANGNLLFYTDGIKVWDKNNNIMTNGSGLLGGISAAYDRQPVIIVPKPLNENLYYIFYATSATFGSVSGFYYSVVNMDPLQYGGNGFIAPALKNIPLKNPAGNPIAFDFITNTGVQISSACMSSTLHKNKDKIWLAFFGGFMESGNLNEYCYEYLISGTGIGSVADGQSPGTSNDFAVTGPNIPASPAHADFNHIKFSPDGSRLSYDNEFGVVAYNFDNEFGNVSNLQNIYTPVSNLSQTGFGLEFSPNNNLLYFSTEDNVLQQSKGSGLGVYKKYMRIRQHNFLGDKDVNQVIVGEIELPDSITSGGIISPIPTINRSADLQLGRDGVIYVSLEHNSITIVNHLAGILLPNNVGATQCGFSNNVMNCAANTHQTGTLPQWVHKAKPLVAWPKVYDAVEPGAGLKVDNGNVIAAFALNNMGNNINHNGPVNVFGGSVHYNSMSGTTTWVTADYYTPFTMSNGNLQYKGSDIQTTATYRNAATGITTAGPAYVPINEKIIADDNGVYITSYIDQLSSPVVDELWVHASPFINNKISLPQISGYYIDINRVIFNPATKRLFVSYLYHPLMTNVHLFYLATYQLNNNVLSNPMYYQINYPIAEINSLEEVFVFDNNGVIQKCDYQNNSYTPLNVSNNSSLTSIITSKQTVEDKILAVNFNDGKIYCFNTNPAQLTTKKISAFPNPNFQSPSIVTYFFDGNNVYLTGGFSTPSFTIGNQTMPLLGNTSAFITKFNIQTDFSFRQGEESLQSKGVDSKAIIPLILQNKINEAILLPSIEATLSPNPAKNSLVINLKQKGKETASSFVVSITNALGVNVLIQNTKQVMLTVDISGFRTGIYYVTISTDKGDKTTRMFMKE